MLFHVTWDFVDSSEAGQKRTLELFARWTPGPGQFQAFYGFADGGGIINFIEENNKVRFEINAEAARRTGLNISSELLKLARLVKS